MKLKTLKDFENMIPRYEHGDMALVRIRDIKAEAIKWILLDNNQKLWEEYYEKGDHKNMSFMEFCWRKFNNITSEDLK